MSALSVKKKVVQVAERTSPCLILLHCFMLQEGSGKQWEPTPRGREWMPKWSWCQPRLEKSFGSLCCYWCTCCCTGHRCLSFTIHIPHLVSDEMALLTFFRFIQYKKVKISKNIGVLETVQYVFHSTQKHKCLHVINYLNVRGI